MLNELVQLGFHFKAVEGWVERVQAATEAGAGGGGRPSSVALATGLAGRLPAMAFIVCFISWKATEPR